MHAFHFGDFLIQYNPDMSGNVFMKKVGMDDFIVIEGRALLMFMAHYVRERSVALMEQLSDEEVLARADQKALTV